MYAVAVGVRTIENDGSYTSICQSPCTQPAGVDGYINGCVFEGDSLSGCVANQIKLCVNAAAEPESFTRWNALVPAGAGEWVWNLCWDPINSRDNAAVVANGNSPDLAAGCTSAHFGREVGFPHPVGFPRGAHYRPTTRAIMRDIVPMARRAMIVSAVIVRSQFFLGGGGSGSASRG